MAEKQKVERQSNEQGVAQIITSDIGPPERRKEEEANLNTSATIAG
jgi:hypothetical protein